LNQDRGLSLISFLWSAPNLPSLRWNPLVSVLPPKLPFFFLLVLSPPKDPPPQASQAPCHSTSPPGPRKPISPLDLFFPGSRTASSFFCFRHPKVFTLNWSSSRSCGPPDTNVLLEFGPLERMPKKQKNPTLQHRKPAPPLDVSSPAAHNRFSCSCYFPMRICRIKTLPHSFDALTLSNRVLFVNFLNHFTLPFLFFPLRCLLGVKFVPCFFPTLFSFASFFLPPPPLDFYF